MYKRIIKSLSHHIDSALRLHFSRRNERVPAEVCPVVCFAGTPVAIAITVRLRLCPPKPSASLHPGASRHPFTWPWAAMGPGRHLPAGSPVVFRKCHIRSKNALPHTFPTPSYTSGKRKADFQVSWCARGAVLRTDWGKFAVGAHKGRFCARDFA